MPVVISEVLFAVSLDTESSAPGRTSIVGYKVKSELGGELRAAPEDLRPDTILDRISSALERAEEEELQLAELRRRTGQVSKSPETGELLRTWVHPSGHLLEDSPLFSDGTCDGGVERDSP